MATRTEQEIMKNWKYEGPPLVSVVCITYNHGPYIRDAIAGFLMQETDFPFEIVIHVDASTDGTADMITEYAREFPHLIKPIYQSKNQYSRGVKTILTALEMARGEFVALCEGDDFWTIPNKLSKQALFLQQNENYSFCFHRAKIVTTKGEETGRYWPSSNWSFEKTNLLDIIEENFISTQTVMCRNKNLHLNNIRALSQNLFFTDWAIHTLNALYGDIFFSDEVMACYRVSDEGVTLSTPLVKRLNDVSLFYDRLSETLEGSLKKHIKHCKYKHRLEFALALARSNDFAQAQQIIVEIPTKYKLAPSSLWLFIKIQILLLSPFFYEIFKKIVIFFKRIKLL